jgi:1-acyl-sn-glycerol-3-phosphate acyltransferase
MIETLPRELRKIGRISSFLAVLLRAKAEFRRVAAKGPVPIDARVRLLQGWCRQSLEALGVQVAVEGRVPTSGLLLSNHLSYLDILACSSATPCAFVSKAEVQGWPIIGDLAEYGGTIFVQREVRSASRTANQQITEYLRSGIAVVLFPEGTTTNGSHILRFHSSMVQPAIDAEAKVTPCAVRYRVSTGKEIDVAWWGDMTLFPHAWKLLGNETITATVAFGERLSPSANRKLLSDAARQSVIALRTKLVGAH